MVEDTIKATDLVTNTLVVTDGFDLSQSWVNVTSERASGVTYTNDTGKPIELNISARLDFTGYDIILHIDGSNVASSNMPYTPTARALLSGIQIPNGSTYKANITTTYTSLLWTELR